MDDGGVRRSVVWRRGGLIPPRGGSDPTGAARPPVRHGPGRRPVRRAMISRASALLGPPATRAMTSFIRRVCRAIRSWWRWRTEHGAENSSRGRAGGAGQSPAGAGRRRRGRVAAIRARRIDAERAVPASTRKAADGDGRGTVGPGHPDLPARPWGAARPRPSAVLGERTAIARGAPRGPAGEIQARAGKPVSAWASSPRRAAGEGRQIRGVHARKMAIPVVAGAEGPLRLGGPGGGPVARSRASIEARGWIGGRAGEAWSGGRYCGGRHRSTVSSELSVLALLGGGTSCVIAAF